VTTFAVTVSHAVAAGTLPTIWSVLVAFVIASVICVGLAGRGLSWVRLALAVGASQLLFHLLLSVDFGASATSLAMPAGHLHHAAVPAAGSIVPAAMGTVASPAMWVAHLIAAVVTVAAIGAGEKAIAALVRLARSPFRKLRPVATAPGPAPRVPMPERPVLVMRPSVLSVMRRRGPPLFG
jgi:hypothetical protein